MKASSSPSPSPSPSSASTPPLRDPLRHLAAAAAAASPSATTTTAGNPSIATPKSPPSKSRKLVISSSPSNIPPRPLSADGEIPAALRHLRSSEPPLSPLIDSHPPPSFHEPPDPPFLALSRSILYQQLAFKAASSVYSRFVSLCGGAHRVLPEIVLSLPPNHLRQIGVSDRKASYLLDLARKYHHGILSDSSVSSMDDRSLFSMLTMVKGIGSWSVHMFMIFSLHRPDVLPVGDLGVRKGVQILYALDALPRPSQMEQLCQRWRPYRSVASWYMWRLVEARGGGPGLSAAASSHSHLPQQELLLPPQPSPPPPPAQLHHIPMQSIVNSNALTSAIIQMDQQHHSTNTNGNNDTNNSANQQQQQPQQQGEEEVVAVHQQHEQQHLISPIQGFQNLGGWSWRSL